MTLTLHTKGKKFVREFLGESERERRECEMEQGRKGIFIAH